jgi:hypothetical protein
MAEMKQNGSSKKAHKFSFGAVKAYFKQDKSVKPGTTHSVAKDIKEKISRRKVEVPVRKSRNEHNWEREGLDQNNPKDQPEAGTKVLFKSKLVNQQDYSDQVDGTDVLKRQSQSQKLYFGTAYQNKEFDFSETIAAVSGLNVPELVRKAEDGDLLLDEECLGKLKGDFSQ